MSARSTLKGMASLCAIAFLLSASAPMREAEAQAATQQQPVLTIADCPDGYELGIQDLPAQQQDAKQQNNSGNAPVKQYTPQFVTGCVPKQQQDQGR